MLLMLMSNMRGQLTDCLHPRRGHPADGKICRHQSARSSLYEGEIALVWPPGSVVVHIHASLVNRV